MNQPDYVHLENLIIGAITDICRNKNVNREKEMTMMIDFLSEMHIVAIMTLSGAVLMSGKMELDSDEPDQERVDQMLAAVKALVEAVDANFSVQIRERILALVLKEKLPNPFKTKQSSTQ
jgi:hypothetical protein